MSTSEAATTTASMSLSCLLYGAGDARFEERRVPSLVDRPYDVLVEVAYTGVCGSDVHFWVDGGIIDKVRPDDPVTMGHEASGTVAATGSKVKRVAVGDRVALEPGFPCRRCSFCIDGRYHLCDDMKFAADPRPGAVTHGTLTKLFAIPEELCYKLPESVALDEGVLMEPLAVAVHATRLARVKPGQKVVVLGAGTVGLMSCAVAREFGAASVVVADVNKDRLKFALDSSFATATYAVDVSLDAVGNASRLKEQCSLAAGSDIIIEATGVASSIHTGLEVIKKGGAFVQVGFGKKIVDFPVTVVIDKEVNFTGSFRYGAGDFELALDLVRRRKISVKSLITKVVPFQQAADAWEIARQGQGIKTLIEVRQDA